jgi:hypothetical protein
MDITKINFNDILNLEFLHDNSDDINVIKGNENCFDTINRKKIIIDTTIEHPEFSMKEYIFKNIDYNNLKIINTPYKDNINDDDNSLFKNTIILVFDNIQLRSENIKLMKYIFKDKIIKIYIPFIFFAEQLLKNVKPDTIKSMIDKYRTKYSPLCDEIIIDNYFTEDDNLIEFYKKEIEDIGFYFDNTDDKLINYKVFSNNNNLITDGKINDTKKKDMNYQLNILYKYFNQIRIGDKRNKFNNYINNLKTDFNLYFVESNKIKEDIDFTNKTINDVYNKVRAYIISMKEARDTYYLIEINKMKKEHTYNESQFFYITTDEITNCRCILEKISSINILGDIPRYIITINNNKIILKLFNIFQNLIKITDTDNEIYKLIESVRKINSQKILSDTKSLIIKEYVGGKLDLKNKKVDLFTLDLNKLNILKQQTYNIMDYNIMDYNIMDYNKIMYYIDDIENKRLKLFSIFDIDNFKNVEEITKQNSIFIDTIKQADTIMNELINLYDTIEPIEIIKNFKNFDKRYIFNEKTKDVDEYTDEQLKELEEIEKTPDISNFIKHMELIFIKEQYKKYNNIIKKTITYDNWKGIYCAWWLNIGLNYKYRDESIKFYKYIFPKIFELYPIEDFIIMFNIESEHFIRQKCTVKCLI